jgi:enterochelin esterase-like enzyme
MIFSLLSLGVFALPEVQLTRHSIQSTSLKREMHYTIWVPQVEQPPEQYPLLVMLHGLGDTDQNWSRTSVPKLYQQAIEEGLPPHIVVVPDGERGYWVDHLGSDQKYASWVLEVIDAVEAQFPISQDIGYRTLMGLSMGAWGTLSIGLQHPNEFGQLIAMSPTDVFLATKKSPSSSLYTKPFGNPLHTPFIAAKAPREWLLRGAGHNQRIAMIYGSAEKEKFSKGAQRFIATAQAQNIDISVLVVENGTHSWDSTWKPDSFLWWMRWLTDIQNP